MREVPLTLSTPTTLCSLGLSCWLHFCTNCFSTCKFFPFILTFTLFSEPKQSPSGKYFLTSLARSTHPRISPQSPVPTLCNNHHILFYFFLRGCWATFPYLEQESSDSNCFPPFSNENFPTSTKRRRMLTSNNNTASYFTCQTDLFRSTKGSLIQDMQLWWTTGKPMKKRRRGDFSGGPVAKIPCSQIKSLRAASKGPTCHN